MDTALHFSGGRDSLACLYLYRERWDEILVCWVNTGAAYPSVLEFMCGWKERLPHFLEIRTDQPGQIERSGYPADVVPMRSTPLGKRDFKGEAPRIQSVFACCAENIWFPMQNAMKAHGITKVIRGQRREEMRTGPMTHGSLDQGIEYILPIEDWTAGQVMAYLKEVGAEIPEYYETERTSRDCWNCTAYVDENVERILALPDDMRIEVRRRLNVIHEAVNTDMEPLRSLL